MQVRGISANGGGAKCATRGGLLLAAFVFAFSTSSSAHDYVPKERGMENETPAEFTNVGIDPHLGEKIDMNLKFRDHEGREVTLGEYTKSGKPLLLSLAYYSCPSLCNFHLNGINDAVRLMKQPVGEEFNLVVVSFDPKEKPELANAKRANYLKAYARPEGDKGWHFLTGDQKEIDALTKAVGFKYRWDESQKQYAHASAAYAVAPDGTLTRYLFGITFEPKTIRLSMLEASNGQVGTLVDKLILYCFHFDPKANKYTLAAFNVMRAGGILVMLVLGMFLIPFWLRARKGEVR